MKNAICFLIFFLSFSALHAQDADVLVSRVKAKLDRVQDYQAEGRLKLDVAFVDAPPGPVTIYYKKPDRFKIKKKGGVSVLPKGGISFNLGTLLSSGYEVIPAKDAMVNGKNTKVVKLLPSEESGDVVLTTLYIDETALVIRKAVVTTRDNGTYDMEMEYGNYASWGLPDKMKLHFNTKDFKLPKGISFEYEKGTAKKDPPKVKKGTLEISYKTYVINKGVDDKVFSKDN